MLQLMWENEERVLSASKHFNYGTLLTVFFFLIMIHCIMKIVFYQY